MIILMIIAVAGLIATTGPGDYVVTKDTPVHRPEPGGNRK